jgi:hypothetical protein
LNRYFCEPKIYPIKNAITHNFLIKKKNNMKLIKALSMPIGLILLSIAIVMDKFMNQNDTLDFLIGFLYGLSIVLNIYYIIAVVRKAKQ